jgi:hypothetical protein
MNWMRAIGYGALLWVLIFFEVSIMMFGLGLQTGLTYYIIHYIFLIIFVGIFSSIYFNGKHARAGFWQGLGVGIVFTIVGIILDFLITIQLFVKNYSFFSDAWLWVGYALGILIAGIVGSIKK